MFRALRSLKSDLSEALHYDWDEISKAESLFLAAKKGQVAVIKRLFKKNDFRPSDLWGALTGAVSGGQLRAMKHLVEYKDGKTICFASKEGQSLLVYAARSGELAMVEWLLSRGAHLAHDDGKSSHFDDAGNYVSSTCLAVQYAEQAGYVKVVQLIKSYCEKFRCVSEAVSDGNVSQLMYLTKAYYQGELSFGLQEKECLLKLAGKSGKSEVVRYLYTSCCENSGKDMQACWENAIRYDHVSIVQWFWSFPSSELLQNIWLFALQAGGPKVCQWLLHTGNKSRRVDETLWIVANSTISGNETRMSISTSTCTSSSSSLSNISSSSSSSKDSSSNSEQKHDVLERTALALAAEFGNLHAVKALLEAKASINRKSSGDSPIFYALNKNRREVVEHLLQAGANAANEWNLSEPIVPYLIKKRLFDLLLWSVNNLAVNLEEMIPDIRRTPLCYCAEQGSLEGVKFLINAGACINKSSLGKSPIVYASCNGHIHIVDYLCHCEALLTAKDPILGSCLIEAISNNHLSLVKYLVNNKLGDVDNETVNLFTGEERSPLIVAIEGGHTEIVRFLIHEANADVNRVQNDGTIAVDVAAKKGDHELLLVLLQFQPDLRESNALGYALDEGQVEIVRLLVSVGARLGGFNMHKPGMGMLLDAVHKMHTKIIRKALASYGWDRQTARLVGRYSAMTWDEADRLLRR